MARYGMVINVDRCTGCYACFIACKDEFSGNDFPPLSLAQADTGPAWIGVSERERGTCSKVKVSYVPLPCLQCENAPCITAANNGAVYRRADGIVIIDPEKAQGQRGLVEACPHQVIIWNEQLNVAQKCTFCAHLLDDDWEVPRCVEACPVNALVFGDYHDPGSEVSQIRLREGTEELHPEYGLQPTVTYQGLPKRLIVGEIVLADKKESCTEGILVTLHCGDESQSITTDNFGDFEFDGLETDTEFVLQIGHEGYEQQELTVRTDTDINVGTIFLVGSH